MNRCRNRPGFQGPRLLPTCVNDPAGAVMGELLTSMFVLNRVLLIVVSCLLACPALAATLSETWQTGYTGGDAKGPHVIAYWQFRPGAEMEDSSGHGNTLTLAAAVAVASGKFD